MEEKKIDLSKVKMYLRIDYTDDDALLELMYATGIQEMKDLISPFDEDELTARQELILLCMIKNLYENRDEYAKSQEALKTAVSSMLLKEMYKGVS